MTAKPGSMRLVANGGTCTQCGEAVPISLEGLGAMSPEQAVAEMRRQAAAHRSICPQKGAPPKTPVLEEVADA